MDDGGTVLAAAAPRVSWARRVRRRWSLARKLLRISRLGTLLLGPLHRRARRLIEIDITYACNLNCFNCNRSCEQAPTGEHMTLDQIERFVAESVARRIRWVRIRLLGGEPTLHPQFFAILDTLRAYRAQHSPETLLEVTTNGHGEKVRCAIARIPADVTVNDTAKEGPVQPAFRTFNVAAQDLRAYRWADYRNGCWYIEGCGCGLGPSGYYPCAIAAGIDRIVGYDMGRRTLPDDADDMEDQLATFCRLCGHFKQGRAEPVLDPVQSVSWREAYARYRANRPRLTRY